MPHRTVTIWIGIAGAAAIALSPVFVATPAWAPHKIGHALHLVVPFAPGGPTDALARRIAEEAGKRVEFPVIVDNVPGAGGAAGAGRVKSADPDGAMLLFTPNAPITTNPWTFPSLPYDPVLDFDPVTQVGVFDYAIAVAAKVPAKTLTELIAEAKSRGSLPIAVPGSGAPEHFVGTLLARSTGAELKLVPYRGAAAALTAVTSGDISAVIATANDLAAAQRSGLVRVLATSGSQRSSIFPDVPTFNEAGFDFPVSGWYAVFAPAKTPPELVRRLNETIVAAVNAPATQELLKQLGVRPTGTTPERLAEIQRADTEFWAKAVSTSGLKFQ
jgi:tripartite-type tricarboxylate transporter receptor subunit TctC